MGSVKEGERAATRLEVQVTGCVGEGDLLAKCVHLSLKSFLFST